MPGLAHNITSPMSPCEGMIKDLSLDALQLCERDGKITCYLWGVFKCRRSFARWVVMVLINVVLQKCAVSLITVDPAWNQLWCCIVQLSGHVLLI